jgi:uncharacterized protein
MSPYTEQQRALQARFDTRGLADRLDERFVQGSVIDPPDREFIERLDMFFIATVDSNGHPQCSYKGGEPGFVRVLDEHTLAFPSYDGNGMYLSAGNIATNPYVGLIFVDFERQRRLRLNGAASIEFDDPLLEHYPGAQMMVRVHASEVFANCPRYVHHYTLVERSTYVPKAGRVVPVPDWKRKPLYRNVLPSTDPARETTILYDVPDE